MTGREASFGTRDAVRATGLSPARIRYCVRTGLISPPERRERRYRYGFDDLLLLKATKRLLDAGVPLRRIRRAYSFLRGDGRGRRRLTELAFDSLARDIVVARGGTRWRADSGQLMLRFEAPPPSAAAVVQPLPKRPEPPQLSADEWYDLGVELEASSTADAMETYRRALEVDPQLMEAHINLGRLLHIAGDREGALDHYTRALQLEPSDAIPAFNIGVVLEDLERTEEALAMYLEALRRDPALPDVHYNLALLYERRGRRWEALKHLRSYKRLMESLTGGMQ